MKESLHHRSGGGRLWEMIGRQIAALGMEIVVRYGKEGKDVGLDSEVMLVVPWTDKFAFKLFCIFSVLQYFGYHLLTEKVHL